MLNAGYYFNVETLVCMSIGGNMLELDTEKEGFMAYTAPEDAQRPRAVYAINPDFRGI